MKLDQQEILRELLDKKEISRAQFCAQYEVTLRALNSYLLPTPSKGFRVMPSELYSIVEDDLINVLDTMFERVYVGNFDIAKHELVSFERNRDTIYFPRIYLHKGLYDMNLVGHIYDINSNNFEADGINADGTFFSEEISFKPTTQLQSSNLSSSEYHALSKAETINGDSYWLQIIHYKTSAQAQAAREAIYYAFSNMGDGLNDSLENSISTVSFNGSYFLFFMSPAPDWYPNPLVCYTSKGLQRNIDGDLDYHEWHHVIDDNGNVIDMPLPPPIIIHS